MNLKKCLVILLTLLLTGCGTQETFETVGEVSGELPPAEAQQIDMVLPDEAVDGIQEGDTTLYECNGYTLTLQTMPGGDLGRTLKTVTGHEQENLHLLQTETGAVKNYYCAWTTAAEEGLQVGRTQIMDDGNYHYAVTTIAQEAQAGELRETWQQMFATVGLAEPHVELNTGS